MLGYIFISNVFVVKTRTVEILTVSHLFKAKKNNHSRHTYTLNAKQNLMYDILQSEDTPIFLHLVNFSKRNNNPNANVDLFSATAVAVTDQRWFFSIWFVRRLISSGDEYPISIIVFALWFVYRTYAILALKDFSLL